MILPADELAALRAEAELALPDTCTIQTQVATNTKGSVAYAYADTYTGVPCRLAGLPQEAKDQGIGTVLTAVTDLVLTVAFDQDVPHTAQVVHAGVTYAVVGVSNEHASHRTTRRVRIRRLQ